MKKIGLSLLLFILVLPVCLMAQETKNGGYLFPEFQQGTVLLKNGTLYTVKLNYNCISGIMLFKDEEDQTLAFSDVNAVVAVTIGDRVFIKGGGDSFYEQKSAGNGFYYILWSAKVISNEKGGAYGTYSSTTAVTSYSGFTGSDGKFTSLKPNERMVTALDSSFYLKINNRFRKINSAKSLTKLFKGHEPEVESFVKEQSIDFNKSSDMERVVVFCEKFAK